MDLIPLAAVPNQSVAFNVDGAYWQIHIFQAVDKMHADVTRNGTSLINGTGCFGGIALLPYDHLFDPTFGNFIFDVDADWTEFGTACKLYYLNKTELAQYNSFFGT
jgi:hypothetical protein